MILPNTTPKNPYYFIENGIIFKISSQNVTSDSCGKHYMFFDTEEKEIKKGQRYINNHGDVIEAEVDNTYDVSKGTAKTDATITLNKGVFPWFEVSFSYKVMENNVEVTKTGKQIYWLDNFIEDGDKFSSSESPKFKKRLHSTDGEDENDKVFTEYYKTLVLNEMAKDFASGYAKKDIEEKYGMFIVGQTANINGIKGTVTSVSSTNAITSTDIEDAIKSAIKLYGNNLLKDYGKYVKTVAFANGSPEALPEP